MAEKKFKDPGLKRIGDLLHAKRIALGPEYKTREKFIYLRSDELFGGDDWLSIRHLSSIELGNNWISIEKLMILAAALEEDPVDLFAEILSVYNNN